MRHFGFFVAFSSLLLAGCASSDCRPFVGNPSVTPSSVAATRGHVGEPIQWGGTLVEVLHRKDGTELEVIAYPLDGCGRPRTESGPTGRFIVVYPGFLEAADYEAGGRVSAIGRIIGIREGQLGDTAYNFPLLESYKVRRWPDAEASGYFSRPWFNVGIGGGSGGVYGGVGVIF